MAQLLTTSITGNLTVSGTITGTLSGSATSSTYIKPNRTTPGTWATTSTWAPISGTYVWGQSFGDSSISSDTGDINIVLRSDSTAGGAGAVIVADGGFYALNEVDTAYLTCRSSYGSSFPSSPKTGQIYFKTV